jgi:quercetin dioxygenase-like cupin family protein
VSESPVQARFVDGPASLVGGPCVRVLVAAVRGPVSVTSDPAGVKDTLGAGDVGVYANASTFDLKGAGLAVAATYTPKTPCNVKAALPLEHVMVKASAAPELRWAKGAMSAHLDVGTKLSPDVYLGRLEGTAAVPEHNHPTSWEILAAVEASGTFVLGGTEGRLGPKQIVVVPPGAKHAWKPDPGSKLVAIQLYTPPGPEQRFVALAAGEKDAGADASK